MPLNRFATQTELAKVFKQYHIAFETLGHRGTVWPEFNDFQILRSVDNVGVYYTPETALFGGTEEIRKKEGSVEKSIVYRLLDCAAYFLAQNIPSEEVPDKLRLCMAICHDNLHWTGVIATIDSFQQKYQELYDVWMKNDLTYRKHPDQNILHNRAKNAIYAKLGIILEPSEIATDEATKISTLVNFFQKGQPMVIEHYDSINAEYYTTRIQQSLHNINTLSKLQPRICSQQQGNTCGDHTTINLFVAGMMNTIPVINESGTSLTSTILRNITDSVDLPANTDNVNSVLRQIPLAVEGTATLSVVVGEQDPVEKCNAVANNVYDLINEAYDLAPETTTGMVHLAICKANPRVNPNDENIQSSLDKSQKDIFEKLVRLFTGDNPPDHNCIPYASLAILIAKDYCAAIENEHLLQQEEIEQNASEMSELAKYETIFTQLKDEITKKIEEFEKNKKFTHKKHPWELGWAGSRSRISHGSVDYYVPKTIQNIYSKITSYEAEADNTNTSNKTHRLNQARTTLDEISQALEAKVRSHQPMQSAILSFFRELVSRIFGYKRSDETISTYSSMLEKRP